MVDEIQVLEREVTMADLEEMVGRRSAEDMEILHEMGRPRTPIPRHEAESPQSTPFDLYHEPMEGASRDTQREEDVILMRQIHSAAGIPQEIIDAPARLPEAARAFLFSQSPVEASGGNRNGDAYAPGDFVRQRLRERGLIRRILPARPAPNIAEDIEVPQSNPIGVSFADLDEVVRSRFSIGTTLSPSEIDAEEKRLHREKVIEENKELVLNYDLRRSEGGGTDAPCLCYIPGSRRRISTE